MDLFYLRQNAGQTRTHLGQVNRDILKLSLFFIPYFSGTLDFGKVHNTSRSKCNVLASKAIYN